MGRFTCLPDANVGLGYRAAERRVVIAARLYGWTMDRAFLSKEVRRTIQRPQRLLAVLDSDRRRAKKAEADSIGPAWDGDVRSYSSYDAYVRHQRSKLEGTKAGFAAEMDRRLQQALPRRLGEHGLELAGRSVLCLAARLGGEVRAFQSLGAFAVGIDLNPGLNNPWVLPGDFHDVQFPDHSVDVVYTNSLDHSLELERVVSEAWRLIGPGGHAVVEAMRGLAEGGSAGKWESKRWDRTADVADAFVDRGFCLIGELPTLEPWAGMSYVLRREHDPVSVGG